MEQAKYILSSFLYNLNLHCVGHRTVVSSDADEILETITTFFLFEYALENLMHVVNLPRLGINNYR